MKLDSQNKPHIIYTDDQMGSGNYGPYYSSKVDGVWTSKRIVDYGGVFSSMVLDAQDKPYIAVYSYDQYGGSSANNIYKLDNNGKWGSFCPITDEIASTFSSLNLDPNGYPRITYANSGVVYRYAQWTGVEWLSSDISNISGSVARSVAAGFDPNGRPSIGYIEQTDDSQGNPGASFNSAKLE